MTQSIFHPIGYFLYSYIPNISNIPNISKNFNQNKIF